MNPRPVIVALCCAIVIVATVYFGSRQKVADEFRSAWNNIKDRKTIVQCEQCYRWVTREVLNDPNGPHKWITCPTGMLHPDEGVLVPCRIERRKCRVGGCPDPGCHYRPSESQNE